MQAGGIGRLHLDGMKVGEKEIPRTAGFLYTLDEGFNVGCDKQSPVTPEYEPGAAFSGKVVRVDFDLRPNLRPEPEKHAEMHVTHAMIKQ